MIGLIACGVSFYFLIGLACFFFTGAYQYGANKIATAIIRLSYIFAWPLLMAKMWAVNIWKALTE